RPMQPRFCACFWTACAEQSLADSANHCHSERSEEPAVRRRRISSRVKVDWARIVDAMKKLVFVFALFQICATAQAPTPRPRILGIDHVSFYTTAPDGVKKLYGDVLGLSSADPVEPGGTLRYMVGTKWVGYSPAPDPKSTDRMDHVALRTDNIAAMRKYLIAKGIKVPQIQGRGDHSLFFVLDDPDGHKIEFVERGKSEAAPSDSGVSHHMIHAGFLVYHQEA